MERIDARGLDCPKPVVETKKALQEKNNLKVLVDNQVAADNVAKLARKLNCKVTTLEEDGEYELTIKKLEEKKQQVEGDKGKVYFIASDTLGEGAKELGEVLMKGFLSTLLEVTPLPDKIIFINSGVKLPTLNEEAKTHLKELEKEGVTILVCGTCLDYYGLKEELKLGTISNMYEILESINENQVVKI